MYTIRETKPIFTRRFPVARTHCEAPNRNIDLPPRPLAIHRAIALILHLSDIDHILRDMEDPMVKSDGTTELWHLVTLRLGGSWNGIKDY